MLIKEALKLKNGSYILEKILNKDKSFLFLNDDLEVPKEFFEIYEKVESGYPIEYIFNEVFFYGEKFYVKEGVLIPRDDTEVVVEKIIQIINSSFSIFHSPFKIVDCCTGSGVIAITLKKHFPNAQIIATDISNVAIEVAKNNALLHNADIEIKKCNLFDEKGDVLVANPPYVENSHKKPNSFEPDIAFYGGDDGLDIVKELVNKSIDLGYKYAIIEIGYNQKEILSEFLDTKNVEYDFFNDLGGRIRGVMIRLQ